MLSEKLKNFGSFISPGVPLKEASQRKSLQGLDNVSADGAESFQRITRIVEELEGEYGVSKD